MGLSPFAKRDTSPLAKSNRRRSTRIDYETPVILSGRDATGQTFREETTTSKVNLHGAKVRTKHQVLVGMLVTIESAKTGKVGKAVCVNTYPAEAGDNYQAIALQVVQPGNLWGVENPPADWAEVEAELGGRTQGPQPGPASVIPPKPAAAPPPPPAPPVAPVPAAPLSRASVDVQTADFEERASRMIESIMETMRVQANVTVRDAMTRCEQRVAALATEAEARIAQRAEQASKELMTTVEAIRTEAMGEMVQEALLDFQNALQKQATDAQARFAQGAANEAVQKRLEPMVAETERRINERTEKSFADLESALGTFRSDLEDELGARREQAVQDIEQALRSRITAMLSTLMTSPAAAPAAPGVGGATKK